MKWALRGALGSVLGTDPVAALCRLVVRFAIPLGGHVSGLAGTAASPIAVTIYRVLVGGFVVQAALVASVPGVRVLAVLDEILGPW